jgi:hypothetical protein
MSWGLGRNGSAENQASLQKALPLVQLTKSVKRLMICGGLLSVPSGAKHRLWFSLPLKTQDLPALRSLLWEVPDGAKNAIEFVCYGKTETAD